jgi:hypothetical protein
MPLHILLLCLLYQSFLLSSIELFLCHFHRLHLHLMRSHLLWCKKFCKKLFFLLFFLYMFVFYLNHILIFFYFSCEEICEQNDQCHKQINGISPLYLSLVPFFCLLTKLVTSPSYPKMSLPILSSFPFSGPFSLTSWML